MNRRRTLQLAAGSVVAGRLAIVAGTRAQETSPQASPGAECVLVADGEGCLPIAPDSARVDLAPPVFSNPTAITNPLFPISDLAQVLQLGEEEGEPLRVEVTLLPETKAIDWNGTTVDTAQSQFVAYSDGRIVEVAIDFYAQADDGAVWYFGEDVFNYEDGELADTDGTWLAGKDGPPGMIMPATPAEGDVYRPENVPDLVFEQVTVAETGVTVDGPSGPVGGAIRTEELLMEGTTEGKVFAPGYGEFRAEAEDELVTVAIGVPIDAWDEEAPSELAIVITAAAEAGGFAMGEDWDAVAVALAAASEAWAAVQAVGLPPLLDEAVSGALAALDEAAAEEDAEAAPQAALDLELAALDLRLLFAPVSDVDVARMDLWSRQLDLDAALGDEAGARGDVEVLQAIRDRVVHTLEEAVATQVDADLADLRSVVEEGELDAVAEVTTRLREHLPG